MTDWQIEEDAHPDDLATIGRGVTEHGRALARDGNARPIACLLKHDGVLIAGGSGRTEYGRLFVQYLWVAEGRRSQGLGHALLTRLEAAARARGCTDALIETLSDRTAAWYGRLGYRALATLPGYVGPFTRHILLKTLANPTPIAPAP